MFGGYSSVDGLVIHYTHWFPIWFGHSYFSHLTHTALQSHSKWNNNFLSFMTIYYNASSTGIPTSAANNICISLSQVTFMLLVLPWFVVSPTNLNGGIFTNKMGFSAPILYFVNINNGGWSLPFFNSANCAAKETYVYDFCT